MGRVRCSLRGDGHPVCGRLEPGHLLLERRLLLRVGGHDRPGGVHAPEDRPRLPQIPSRRPRHVLHGGQLPQPGLLQGCGRVVREVLRHAQEPQGGRRGPHVGHRVARRPRRRPSHDEERRELYREVPGRQEAALRQGLLAGGEDVREQRGRGQADDQPQPLCFGLRSGGRGGQAPGSGVQAGRDLLGDDPARSP